MGYGFCDVPFLVQITKYLYFNAIEVINQTILLLQAAIKLKIIVSFLQLKELYSGTIKRVINEEFNFMPLRLIFWIVYT